MKELKPNDKVNLIGDIQATVKQELGRGGQGIVYLVELFGKQMALKWYLNAPDQKFYKNLEENAKKGAPSDAFLWPEYVTKKEKGSYGYIMPLRPKGYYEFGNFLLAKTQFKSFDAMLNAAMKICDGFEKLHLSGFSYQDLNDGNFFRHSRKGSIYGSRNRGWQSDARQIYRPLLSGGHPLHALLRQSSLRRNKSSGLSLHDGDIREEILRQRGHLHL